MLKRIRKGSIQRRGCLACKSRNKKCDITRGSTSCSYCSKKNIPCEIPDIKIIHFDGADQKKTRKLPGKKDAFEEPFLKTVTGGLSIEIRYLTSNQSLVIAAEVVKTYFKCNHQSSGAGSTYTSTIGSVGLTKLYEKKQIVVNADQKNILYETMQEIPIINEDTLIDENSKIIYGYDKVKAKEVAKKMLLNCFEGDEVPGNDLDDNHYFYLLQYNGGSVISRKKKPKDATNDKNLQLVEVNAESLKNILYLEAPSFINFNDSLPTKNENERQFLLELGNLPPYLTSDIIELLFFNFCENFPNETNKLYFSSCSNSFLAKQKTTLILTVYLPLAFSNVTVFKTLLLWSAWNLHSSKSSESKLKDASNIIENLYNEIIVELNHRLSFRSAVCCDHTMSIVLLLLYIENLKAENTAKYWFGLVNLMGKMISLRGGVENLTKTSTGSFFSRVFSYYYLSNFNYSTSLVNDRYFLTADEFKYIYEISVQEHDSLAYKNWKRLFKIYGRISHLSNLLRVAKCGNGSEISSNINDYGVMHEDSLARVLSEAKDLEQQLDLVTISTESAESDTEASFTPIENLFLFSKEVCYLFISQLIYNNNSSSTATILAVRRSLPILTEIFKSYLDEQNEDFNFYLILPIFVFGCDLIGDNYRKWFVENLYDIYEIRKSEKFLTIIKLTQKVWTLNQNGMTYVNWCEIAEADGLVLPAYV